MSFQSYLEKSLYPGDMNVNVGTVATPSGLDPPHIGAPNGQPEREPEITGMIFEVTIDGHDFGFWSTVGGLAVKFEIAEYRAGDGSNRRWIEPAYTTYTNVKLGRVTTLRYTKQIMDWRNRPSSSPRRSRRRSRGSRSGTTSATSHWPSSGTSTAYCRWPGADPRSTTKAGRWQMETLELAHEGFLPAEG